MSEWDGALAAIDPRWLSLKVAAQYAHIGTSRLIQLALSGTVVGFQDPDSGRGDWIIDRLSLDKYREGQYSAPVVREKALEIMRGIRL